MPTRRGLLLSAAAAVFCLVGLAFGVEEFLLAAVTVGALLLVGAAALLWQVGDARRNLRVRLGRPPPEMTAGDVVSIALGLANTGRRVMTVIGPPELAWHVSYPGLSGRRPPPERTPTSRPSRSPRTWLRPPAASMGVALAPGVVWETAFAVPTGVRGFHSLDPVVVWCTDPLRLLCWPLRRPVATQLVVLPRPWPEEPVDVRPTGRRLEAFVGAPHERAQEGSDEFAGLRRYVPGDRLTRLHWPTLSRSGELLVRQFVDTAPFSLDIVVDTRAWEIEESVAKAAALGLVELGRGGLVTIRTTAGERVQITPGRHARLGLLRSLAAIAPEPERRTSVRGLVESRSRGRR